MAGTLDDVPWLAAAYQELNAGVALWHGRCQIPVRTEEGLKRARKNNPRILEYFTATTLHTHSEATS
jgi:hypothetical protein